MSEKRQLEEDIDQLKKKRRRLKEDIESLEKAADSLAEKAAETRDFGLMTQFTSFMTTAKTKKELLGRG